MSKGTLSSHPTRDFLLAIADAGRRQKWLAQSVSVSQGKPEGPRGTGALGLWYEIG